MSVFDYQPLFERLRNDKALAPWCQELQALIASHLRPSAHGDLVTWRAALESIHNDLWSEVNRAQLSQLLQAFHPWRKGPLTLGGVAIDTEWRSDWKWQRVQNGMKQGSIQPLTGHRVLDVGCGNGYFGWQMRQAGAELVLGIDPTLLFVAQFFVARHFFGDDGNWVIPLGIDQMPDRFAAFDTVFSMGVLYHRQSPIDHLKQLRDLAKPGGQFILETLVVNGDQHTVLVPSGRYARMRNVWFIPSVEALILWLTRCRLTEIAVVDVSDTTIEEQRSTDWMRFNSLVDFLDPNDPTRTIEGYPAPRRAIIRATCPTH